MTIIVNSKVKIKVYIKDRKKIEADKVKIIVYSNNIGDKNEVNMVKIREVREVFIRKKTIVENKNAMKEI